MNVKSFKMTDGQLVKLAKSSKIKLTGNYLEVTIARRLTIAYSYNDLIGWVFIPTGKNPVHKLHCYVLPTHGVSKATAEHIAKFKAAHGITEAIL